MDAETTRSRFPELLQLRLPDGITGQLDEIAAQTHRTRSEVVRQTLLALCRGEMATRQAEARQ